jgi:hypothetical protein
VDLDLKGIHVDDVYALHPKTTLFRGEYDVVDYQVINDIYVAILLPAQVFIVEQLTEQVLSIFTGYTELQSILILSPCFEYASLPLSFVQQKMQIVTRDIQESGA